VGATLKKNRHQPPDEAAQDDQIGGIHLKFDKAEETDGKDDDADPRNEGRCP
jgi:hypothetical protein